MIGTLRSYPLPMDERESFFVFLEVRLRPLVAPPQRAAVCGVAGCGWLEGLRRGVRHALERAGSLSVKASTVARLPRPHS